MKDVVEVMNSLRFIGKRYLSKKESLFLTLFLFMILNTALTLLAPQILAAIIDGIIESQIEEKIIHSLATYFIVVLLVELVKNITSYLSATVGWLATNQIRRDLLKHRMGQTAESINDFRTGELIEIIDGDVKILTEFFSTLLIKIVQSVLLIMGTIIAIIHENSIIGILESIFVIIAILLFRYIHDLAVPKWRVDREQAGYYYGYLGECIEAKEDIIANGASGYVLNTLKKILKKWFPESVKAGVFGSSTSAVYCIVKAIMYAIVLGGGAFFWGKGVLSVGTIFLLYQYNQNIISPIERLRKQIDNLQVANASAKRIEILLQQPIENETGRNISREEGMELKVENLNFGYQNETRVLKGISFTIDKKQTIGIVGRTGSGKTTLAKLLVKMYCPQKEAIYFNGESASGLAVKSIRENIGYVTQDVHILSASLRNNITFFDKSISDECIYKIIRKAGLTDWLKKFENGLDTMISEYKLSGGEVQLIALLRVFLKNPQLVILDEAYASIDPLTEFYINKAMKKLMNNRTTIIITHRLKTLEQVEKVMLIEDGEVIEIGDYKELITNPGSNLFHMINEKLSEGVL